MKDVLKIDNREFDSRLILGTSRYPSPEVMLEALDVSGAQMVTVAIRRINLEDTERESVLRLIDRSKFFVLPNTAGCYTAKDAILTAHLAREARSITVIA